MTPSFENTVSILVKAYLNDTLRHENCAACAVGNLIAHSLGAEVGIVTWVLGEEEIEPAWQNVFCTNPMFPQRISPERYLAEAKYQIDATGYSWQDLAKIEASFESITKREDRMFLGLMAVVDILAEIHQVDLSTAQAAKELFVR